jgi:hypothetical protein
MKLDGLSRTLVRFLVEKFDFKHRGATGDDGRDWPAASDGSENAGDRLPLR